MTTGGGRAPDGRLRETVNVRTDQEDSEEEELDTRVKPPWCSIALATFLSIAGVVLLVTGSLLHAGVIADDVGQRATPMLIVGSICFIPGFYNVRVAYYAWRGNYGYSFNDIPS